MYAYESWIHCITHKESIDISIHYYAHARFSVQSEHKWNLVLCMEIEPPYKALVDQTIEEQPLGKCFFGR